MRLFKKKEALSLEEKLVETISKFNTHISSEWSQIYDESKAYKKQQNIGMGIFTIGAFGVAGSIGFLAVAPAVATVAVAAGFTAFGTAMIGSGATVLAGAGYMGLAKLAEKFKESATRFDHRREEKLSERLDKSLMNLLKNSNDSNYSLADMDEIKRITSYRKTEDDVLKGLEIHKVINKNKI